MRYTIHSMMYCTALEDAVHFTALDDAVHFTALDDAPHYTALHWMMHLRAVTDAVPYHYRVQGQPSVELALGSWANSRVLG